MHHFINEFRPHEARETLKLHMESQVQARINETKNITK